MPDKKTEVFGELKGVEIFRAGKYPQGEFSEKDIGEIAKTYDPSFSKAKSWISHPDKDGKRLLKRAVGWVDKIYAKGKSLFADFKDVPDKFIKLLEEKAFNDRSAEIYMDLEGKGMYLKGLAWLPADENPQVKGLAVVDETQIFEEKDDPDSFVSCQFSEFESLQAAVDEYENTQKLRNILDTFQRMTWDVLGSADNYVLKVGQLKKLISELSEMDQFKESANMAEKDTKTVTTQTTQVQEPAKATETKMFTEEDIKGIVKAAMTEAVGQIKTELSAESKRTAIAGEVKAFCEQMVSTGRMTPAERETEEPMLTECAIKDSTMTFSEGQVATSKKRMDYYRTRQPVVNFGEFGKAGQETTDRTEKARSVATKVTAEFSEWSGKGSTPLGLIKVQSLYDAGFSEKEVKALPEDIVSKDELAAAGVQ